MAKWHDANNSQNVFLKCVNGKLENVSKYFQKVLKSPYPQTIYENGQIARGKIPQKVF